jgi:hypothetical protein
LTGGSVWERAYNEQMNHMVPVMYKIEVDGKPLLDQILRVAVSRDCMLAAIVTAKNEIYLYRLIDNDQMNNYVFINEKKFAKECRVLKIPDQYKEVIDLFIFQNSNLMYGEGKYSMYVCSKNGVLLYEGIDKRDQSSIQIELISSDLINSTLTFGAIDCNSKG